MSIPNWEMDNLTQPDLFGKWVKDDTCAGMYGQSICLNYVERMLTEQERQSDKRTAAALVQTFEEKLIEAPPTQQQIQTASKRRKRKSSHIVWDDEMPAGTPDFMEIVSGPRHTYTLDEVALICQRPVEDFENEDTHMTTNLLGFDVSDMAVADSYRRRFCGKGKGQMTMLDKLGVPASVIERPKRQTAIEVKADCKPSHMQAQLL